jgi:MoxR-like ATPase
MNVADKKIDSLENILNAEEIISIQEEMENISIPLKVKNYIVNIIDKLREKDNNIVI